MLIDDISGHRILLIVIPRVANEEAHFFVGTAALTHDGLELLGDGGEQVARVVASREALRGFDPAVLPRLIVREHWSVLEPRTRGVERCVSVFADVAPPGGLAMRLAFFGLAENAAGQPVLFQGSDDDDDDDDDDDV